MVRRLPDIAAQDHDLVLEEEEEEAVIVKGIDVGLKAMNAAVPIKRGRGALADTNLVYSWNGFPLCPCN
jgi:hypothetical protein